MEVYGFQRSEYVQRFEDARLRARLWRLWHRLIGRPETLLSFDPIIKRLKQRTGFHRGVQEIVLQQIVGSIDKATDFDRDFRPLSDRQRNRWVNVKAQQTVRGWEPIIVHQIGNLYFIEDGHHRVSVARNARLEVIEAKVIEYPLDCQFGLNDDLQTILRRLKLSNKETPEESATQLPLQPCI